MMKFFTALFVIVYLWRIFSQHVTLRKVRAELFNGVKYNEMNGVLIEKVKEGDGDAILYFILGLWTLLFDVLKLFYIIFAIQYADITVWFAYIIFCIFVLIYKIVKSKTSSIRNKTMEGVGKYSIRLLVFYIIDLMFFVYMIFKLFV